MKHSIINKFKPQTTVTAMINVYLAISAVAEFLLILILENIVHLLDHLVCRLFYLFIIHFTITYV
jgi:hypothetical protein